MAWAPWEYGLFLAAGDAMGNIHIIFRQDNDVWQSFNFKAHDSGVNSLSWGPPTEPAMFTMEAQPSDVLALPKKRLVSGGIDHLIKVWENAEGNNFAELKTLKHHTGWVRDVAWCNNIGLATDMIASCSEDGKALVWKSTKDGWEHKVLTSGAIPVWKVSWSPVGNLLAVSMGDNTVQIMKETQGGEWETVSKANEEGNLEDM